ncbi:hypothetical protein P692DRAFT_20715759, partial [Suillus brevipes Sb2]
YPISCARACTVASEVFTEAQSFADCKLHIRTRLLASASSNFWNTLSFQALRLNPELQYILIQFNSLKQFLQDKMPILEITQLFGN